MIAVDTNVVSELMKADPAPAVVEWARAVADDQLVVPAVVAAELLHGLGRLPGGSRRDRLESALATFFGRLGDDHVLPFDGRAAAEYAVARTRRERAGTPMDTMDALIAATCRAHGAVLATRNTKDFVGAGVELIDPWAR